MLLVQRHYVPKQRIREILYPEASVDAFEKMFERDKEELRSLGVPIEVGSLDVLFDEPGYRIRPDVFALPAISLAPDEAAVVGLATKVWEHAKLAGATVDALRKLTAAGLDPNLAALQIAETRLTADEPSFDAFWEATQERIPVTFDYRRSGDRRTTTRHVEPWGVVRYSGRWYAVGWDRERQDERVFRLSRVDGAVVHDGDPGSYDVPADTDVRAIARRLAPSAQRHEVVVLVRAGSGHGLRRDATVLRLGSDRTRWHARLGSPATEPRPRGGRRVLELWPGGLSSSRPSRCASGSSNGSRRSSPIRAGTHEQAGRAAVRRTRWHAC